MSNSIEQTGLRGRLALNLIATGKRFHDISILHFRESWLNLGLSAFLTFGNLALIYGALQGEMYHLHVQQLAIGISDLALASKAAHLRDFNLQIMNAVASSMPIEAITLVGIMVHQKKHYPDQDIPLSTFILPKIGDISTRLGNLFMPKPLPDPSLW